MFVPDHRSLLHRLSSQGGAEGVGRSVNAQQLLLAEALHVAVGGGSRSLVFNLVHNATGTGDTLIVCSYVHSMLVNTPHQLLLVNIPRQPRS